MRRTELILVKRAFRERWPIPDVVRVKLVEQMAVEMVNNEDRRARIHAAAVLVMADRLNLESEKLDEQRAERMALERANEECDGDLGPAQSEASEGAGDSSPPEDRPPEPDAVSP